VTNGFIVAFSLAMCGIITQGDARCRDRPAALCVAGLCRSLQFTTVNTLGFVDVAATDDEFGPARSRVRLPSSRKPAGLPPAP